MEREIEELRASLEALGARHARAARWLGATCAVLLLLVGWLMLRLHGGTLRAEALEVERIALDRFGSIVLRQDPDGQRAMTFGYSEDHGGYGVFLDAPDGAVAITLAGRPRLLLGAGPRRREGAQEHEIVIGDTPYLVSAVDPIGIQILERGTPRVALGPFRGEPHVSLLDGSGGHYLVDLRPQGGRGGRLSVHGLAPGESPLAYPPSAVTLEAGPRIQLTNDEGEVIQRIE